MIKNGAILHAYWRWVFDDVPCGNFVAINLIRNRRKIYSAKNKREKWVILVGIIYRTRSRGCKITNRDRASQPSCHLTFVFLKYSLSHERWNLKWRNYLFRFFSGVARSWTPPQYSHVYFHPPTLAESEKNHLTFRFSRLRL